MRTLEGFRSIEINVKEGVVTLTQGNGRYSTESISFPVSQWAALQITVTAEVTSPTAEPVLEVLDQAA